MEITEAVRQAIIGEYKEQEKLQQLARRCKVKPLHDAHAYYEKKLDELGFGRTMDVDFFMRGFYYDFRNLVWDAIRKNVCNYVDIKRITDLKAEDYERANAYAIELIDDLIKRMRP